MSKILILTLVFPPDNVSTAHIMGDLARDLSLRGHSITIMTTTPHYNRDSEAEAKQPLFNLLGPFLKRSNFHGIPVFHILMPKKGCNILLRLLTWIWFHLMSIVVSLIVKKPEVIISPSPPLTIGIVAWIISLFNKARYIYNVQEMYPDIAINMGVIRNKIVIKFLYSVEKLVYKKAASITVISQAMKRKIIKKGINEKKVVFIPNLVEIEDFKPLPKVNPFSQAFAVHDKFTVTYAGNMGLPQGLDVIIDACSILYDESEIRFMMIGDGMQKNVLKRYAEALKLTNIYFVDYQPYSIAPLIYASSDINLVPQTSKIGFDAIPSKVYRIMACGRPIIAITDRLSDLAELVAESKCGLITEPGHPEKLSDAILWAYNNRNQWEKMGENGRLHILEIYKKELITDQYDKLTRSIK